MSATGHYVIQKKEDGEWNTNLQGYLNLGSSYVREFYSQMAELPFCQQGLPKGFKVTTTQEGVQLHNGEYIGECGFINIDKDQFVNYYSDKFCIPNIETTHGPGGFSFKLSYNLDEDDMEFRISKEIEAFKTTLNLLFETDEEARIIIGMS